MPEHSIAEPLLELWREYRRAFSSNLRSAIDTADPEAFHDLRVAVKRMRALWRFIEVIDPAFGVDVARRELARVFRSAGVVRDLHVERGLIEDITSRGADASGWIAALKEQEVAAYIAFVPCAERWRESVLDDAERAIVECASGIPDSVGRIACRASVRDSVALVGLWRRLHPRGDLHELRRVAKEAGYRLFIWKRVFGDDLFAPETPASLDAIQKLLGKWHDHEIARDTVRRDRALRDSVRDAYVMLLRRKRATRMRIRRRLDKFARLLAASPHFAPMNSEITRPASAG